jgi:hypothetical protein
MLEEKDIEIYLKNYFNKNNIDYRGVWPNDITIDIAGEVAEQILLDHHPNTKHFVQGKMFDLETHYLTEMSQDLFNKYYDQARKYLEENISKLN